MPQDDLYSRLHYRRLIAWPRRIASESPFLLGVLSSAPSRRVLDLGCGTGEHARFLAEQGFEVVGVDRSKAMISAARALPIDGVHYVEGDLADLDRLVEGPFGAAICLGNTLPHVTDPAALAAALGGARRAMTRGAPLVIQILNYERIVDQGVRHLPINVVPGATEGEEVVFLRLMTPAPDGGVLFFPTTLTLVAERDPPVAVAASKRVPLRGWRREEVVEALAVAGFGGIELHGDFHGGAYQPDASQDLVVVARA